MSQHGVVAPDRRPAHELTPAERSRLQRAWRQRMLSVLFVVPLYVVVELLVDRFAVHHEAARAARHPPTWLVVMLLVGAAALMAATVWWSRWQLFRPGPARALVLSGERADRLRVARKLRRRQPFEPGEGAVAQAHVDLLGRQVQVVLGSIGTGVLLFGVVAAWSRRGGALVVLAVFAAVGVVLCGWVAVSTRRSLAWAAEQGLRPRRSR